ncbi:hypothetical protein A3H16_01390 [Candidatus Kaiserbacteria bacterium RIFCSPLOWO2_12_FULL_53_8]|uniref:V-type ATP synthase subunit E n=1 Tax=Candidatus Kaiserbacteria bacterium RIFCSPLOWO2_12_FULL_53_8 TaxID=1798529 RepID=A0A1F6G1S0_9BACT|nr:MAG: hypothetical protein A3H16_01390 [Candidatus Kaiserbacteria bacterium RIFCSPLOWO2_12_FULL_53_8]
MAIDNILAAITQETDRRIAGAKEAHAKRIAMLRDESAQRIRTRKQEIDAQHKQEIDDLRLKAETHRSQQRRNGILNKKQELLERCYSDVQKALAKSDTATLGAFLVSCLKGISGAGEVRPVAAHKALLEKIADKSRFTIGKSIDAVGGFVFVSDKQEHDYTFERFVTATLRPQTEVEVSQALFA